MGPTVLKYGNMVRVRDCPYDSMRNRTEIVNLRLTSGKTAVHSDMVMWNKDAPIEAVARQMISTLWGVPQVSVLLENISDDRKEAIKFWLGFYTKNRELLHSDDIRVKNPELNYSQITTRKDGSIIGVNYANVPFDIYRFQSDESKYIFINSSNEEYMCINAIEDIGKCVIKIYDCLGLVVKTADMEINNGATMLNVPVCGFVEIIKKS